MPSFPPVPNLTDLLDEVEALAPLPHVANRAVQVADDERFSAYDLAAVIATETAMTAKVLRRTNSAYYGFPRRISTVHDAVVLIGFRAVRATAIAAAVVDLFPSRGNGRFSSDLFWGHSATGALVAETFAKETGHARADEAFTAAILHDIGRLVLSQYAEEAFNEALRRAMEGSAPRQVAEQDVFGYDHARVGARLAQRWNFPANICAAIADHHAADASPKTAGLSFVVVQANSLCRSYSLWCGLDSGRKRPRL